MNWKVWISLLLFATAAPAITAQQRMDTQQSASRVSYSTAQDATQVSLSSAGAPAMPMTPRQIAEMHAEIYLARKMYYESISTLKGLLKDYPKDAGLMNKIGIAYQEMGDDREASKYYKKSAKADHHFASPLNNLGTVEYERKKYGKAVKYYKKALNLHGDSATIYSNLGYAYFEGKKYDDSMASFRQALEIDPLVFERRGGMGSTIQQRSMTDPGLFYFFVAKSYAAVGDAGHCAHYLKLARDEGYMQYTEALSDPAFAKVIREPEVKDLFPVEKPVVESR